MWSRRVEWRWRFALMPHKQATIKSSAGIYSSFWMVTREDFRVAMSVANGASGESKEEAAPWKVVAPAALLPPARSLSAPLYLRCL